ncbi:SHOCT domain-containing protein [Acidimicrobiia bacterium]|nr:SHOCT domain-containing protein [Acidimicrobiia bacterium]
MSNADEIKKLKDLLDDGAITLDEFEQQKKIILDSQKQNEIDSPFSKLNFKKINFNSKNKKILYIVIALLILFPFRYNLFTSTNSSDFINLLQENNLAHSFSFNTFDNEKQDRNSQGLWGNRYRYTEKVEFEISGHDKGGQIFLCSSRSECNDLHNYFTDLGFLNQPFVYKSSDGKMVAQLNSETPSKIIEKFEEVVTGIRNVEARSHTCYGSRCFSDEW